MKLKRCIKSNPVVNYLHTVTSGYAHENRARRSLRHYQKRAGKTDSICSKAKIQRSLRQRLQSRGIELENKRKGDLHIFLTYALSNWESVLPLALESFGKVTVFDWRGLVERRNGDFIDAEILKAFQFANSKKPVDIVIGYLSGYSSKPETLLEMGRAGAVIFNFCWDDKLNFPGPKLVGRHTSPAAIASAVDLNLTNAPESIIKYEAHDGLAMFWPEAAHPGLHKSFDLPFDFDVSFLGSKYGWRPILVRKLQRKGIKVACFGHGWGNGILSDKEVIKLYSRSRINLGFSGVGYSRKLMCLKARDFEIPMSGGLYLTQDNPELALVYDIGKEIITYRNERDCVQKIEWLLANPEKAGQIREMGRKRALRDHTWENRFDTVFKFAGIIVS